VALHLLLALACALADARAPGPDNGIVVIVAAGTGVPRLNTDELAQVFRQNKRFGDDGKRIMPVNLPANHPVRRAFSQQVLGHSPEEMDDYWRDMYFHGILPPHVLASEEAVIRFVAGTPGSIGYVSACLADRRVTIILHLDMIGSCPR
jgi:ABC-type phosphate transport system substrate-binding protein